MKNTKKDHLAQKQRRLIKEVELPIMEEKDNLTQKQRRLIKEIEELARMEGLTKIFLIDHNKIKEILPSSMRTYYLDKIKILLVRAQVITSYTILDHFLSDVITNYYLGEHTFMPYKHYRHRHTKRYKIFKQYIIDNIYLINKIEHVRKIINVEDFVGDMYGLNNLRNGLAHSYFPKLHTKHKPVWKKHDIFSLEGITKFNNDFKDVAEFFLGIMGYAKVTFKDSRQEIAPQP